VGLEVTGDAYDDNADTQNTAIHYRYSEMRSKIYLLFSPFPLSLKLIKSYVTVSEHLQHDCALQRSKSFVLSINKFSPEYGNWCPHISNCCPDVLFCMGA
jgi:hypothetical protein